MLPKLLGMYQIVISIGLVECALGLVPMRARVTDLVRVAGDWMTRGW